MSGDVSVTAPQRRFRWWQALAILLVANAISVLPAGLLGDAIFYNGFLLPPFAPPDWVFAPVWFVLNVTSLVALALVANAPVLTRRHRLVLISEAAGWLLFTSFTTLYFGLNSPVLGAIDTVAGLAVAVVSFIGAIGLNRIAAGLILPRLLWLLLASLVSVQVALTNVDPFLAGVP
ncbi:tryptophan-rich sensory protein [Synechococcus sp. Tobar12-5m-g]|nr:tryptophan-rich sensory protein [Synechococcus sp. Tobar12-5m-g]